MQKIRQLFFPKQSTKIFKGFGPAFLVIALGIGSGEFILWPYLSAHYGFGILWGALLGISIQLLIIVVLERHTAFLGEDAIASFTRVFKYAFPWILFSTLLGFGWPGFAAMSAQLLNQGINLGVSEIFLSIGVLMAAATILIFGKNTYKTILNIQKFNMAFLFVLVLFLFIYYFDVSVVVKMFSGLAGFGENYIFIPVGISLATFMGAVAYAGSGGNLLLMNSFYVEREGKGLVPERTDTKPLVPSDDIESIKNTRIFTKTSWKQNIVFFWMTGLVLILMLAYISYAVLYNVVGVSDNFSFLIQEARIFSETIHPFIGLGFIISGALALFGVQLGIFDFIGRIAANRPGMIEGSKKQKKHYTLAILITAIFGVIILSLGLTQPNTLIIIGATINAFSMGVIAFLLYRVESKILPKYIRSHIFIYLLIAASIFYISFFIYVLFETFIM